MKSNKDLGFNPLFGDGSERHENMNPARELALYLNVSIPSAMPDGEYRQPEYVSPSYGDGPGDRDPEDAELSAGRNNATIRQHSLRHMADHCTPGSAVATIADELPPIYTAPGESMPDGRIGREAILEAIVESWPDMPDYDYAHGHDFALALGRREWLRQGDDWEYVEGDAKAIHAALTAGAAAAEIRAAVLAGDARYVRTHRAARNGDRAKRIKNPNKKDQI